MLFTCRVQSRNLLPYIYCNICIVSHMLKQKTVFRRVHTSSRSSPVSHWMEKVVRYIQESRRSIVQRLSLSLTCVCTLRDSAAVENGSQLPHAYERTHSLVDYCTCLQHSSSQSAKQADGKDSSHHAIRT